MQRAAITRRIAARKNLAVAQVQTIRFLKLERPGVPARTHNAHRFDAQLRFMVIGEKAQMFKLDLAQPEIGTESGGNFMIQVRFIRAVEPPSTM
jgi:hypothetical protein